MRKKFAGIIPKDQFWLARIGASGCRLTARHTIMSERPPPAEYLAISRGQWDSNLPRAEIESAIDQFYMWLDRLVNEGKMKRGQRLTYEGKVVGRQNVVADGPFGETKEVVGGYWFILADSLEEAAQIAKGNPCLDCGLLMEIRPIDPQRGNPDNTRLS
jgi:hypothetical protein